jgi:hypothetical protein
MVRIRQAPVAERRTFPQILVRHLQHLGGKA